MNRKRYRVIALYDQPPVERSAVIDAENPERAMVTALIERHVPAVFERDEHGWWQPVWWHTRLSGARRWPRLVGINAIEWGENARQRLTFYVTELEE